MDEMDTENLQMMSYKKDQKLPQDAETEKNEEYLKMNCEVDVHCNAIQFTINNHIHSRLKHLLHSAVLNLSNTLQIYVKK